MKLGPKAKLWISLLEVKPTRYDTEARGFLGGYVNVIAPSQKKRKAIAACEAVLNGWGMKLIHARDTETVRARSLRGPLTPEMVELARRVRQTGAAQFDEFFVWDSEEAEEDY